MHFADRTLFLSPVSAQTKAVARLCGRPVVVDAVVQMDMKRDPDTGQMDRGWSACLIDTRNGRHIEWL
jgi:hypothetical protein